MADPEVDPRAVTQAAGAAVRTLTEGGATPRPAAAPADLTGKNLAHFRIDRRLGKGGMGEVWLATDLALERPVALKVLAPEIASDPASRDRFIREARAQARLAHPNICHIYFIGEQDGRLFFSMEYVEGQSLQERLEREGPLTLDQAVDVCRMAAAGLAEAYAHGFTHRDVKPSNLLEDRHGVLKVADFGLVKDSARPEAAAGVAIVGTPLYMAPEQGRGDPVDVRADVYALGVTLHQLVAGKPPFAGETPLDLVSKHQTEPRPRFTQQGGRAALVDALVDRMMAKRPEERPGSYEEVIAALEALSPRFTRPAGFWARSLALLLDVLISIAVGSVVSGLAGVPALPALLTAFTLLTVVTQARYGASPGKAALELEVIGTRLPSRRRGIGWSVAALRFLAQSTPTFAALALDAIFDLTGGKFPSPFDTLLQLVMVAMIFLPPLVLGILATRSAGKRAFWDKVAGTRVVYRRH